MNTMMGREYNGVSREMARLMGENLRQQGLSPSQIHLLGYLDCKREAGVRCTQTDIRRECCHTRSSSVTSLLQALEKDGYISREAGRDARTKLIVLTEKGLRIAHECKQFAMKVEEAFTEGFTQEELEQFSTFIARVKDNIERFASRIKE